MNTRITKHDRFYSLLLVAAMLLSLVVTPNMAFAVAKDTVTLDVGVPNMHIALEYDGYTEEGTSDQNGCYDSKELFNRLTDLKEQINLGTNNGKLGIDIVYKINYPDAASPQERETLGGNPAYKGIRNTTTVLCDPSTTWEDGTIVLAPPEEEAVVSGKLYRIPEGKTEAEATLLASTEVIVKGTDTKVITDEKGDFILYGYSKETTPETILEVVSTDTYVGTEIALKNLAGKIFVKERPAITSADYEVQGLVNDYAKKPETDTEYTVKALNGNKIALAKDSDALLSEATITLSKDTLKTTPFFIYKNGVSSNAIEDVIKVDNTAPVVTEITTEAVNKDVVIKDHGIYSKQKAELLVTLTVTDDESGVDEVVLRGKNADGTTEYKVASIKDVKGKKTATFAIESRADMLKQTLYLAAKDKVGNVTEDILLRGTENASNITLEVLPPAIGETTVNATPKNNWYNKPLHIEVPVTDAESGLEEVTVTLGDKELVKKTYTEKVNAKQTIAFDLTAADIKNYNVNGKVTVVVKAVDNCKNITAKNFDYNVDLNAPSVAISGFNDQDKLNANPAVKITETEEFTGEAENTIKVVVTRDNAEVLNKEYKKTAEVNLDASLFNEDGKYEIIASATDAAGNKSKAVKKSFTKDTVAPVIEVTGAEEGKFYNTTKTVTVSVDELNFEDNNVIVKATKEVNGKETAVDFAWANDKKVSKHSINLKETGKYKVTVKATDKAGNKAAEKTLSFTVDNEVPEVAISGFNNKDELHDAPVVKISETENYMEAAGNKVNVEVKKDSTKVFAKEYTDSKVLANIVLDGKIFSDDAEYEITASATDAAGNKSAVAKKSFIKDTVAPAVTINAPEQGKYFNKAQNIEVVVKEKNFDNNKVNIDVTKFVDNKETNVDFAWTNDKETSKHSITVDETGLYNITVTAQDKAGNKSTTEKAYFTVDHVKPVLSIIGFDAGAFLKETPDVKITNEENYVDAEGSFFNAKVTKDNKEVKFNGNFEQVPSSNLKKDLFSEDGIYEVLVTGTDAAGNVATPVMKSFTKDTTAPTVKVTGAEEGGYYNKAQTVTVSVDELNFKNNTVTIKAVKYVDGKETEIEFPWSNDSKTTSHSITVKDTGKYTVTAYAEDKAGNRSETSKLSFTVDNVAPVLSMKGFTEGSKINVTPDVIISETENYLEADGNHFIVNVTRDGKEVSNKKYEKTAEITIDKAIFNADGVYKITVTGKDAAGNEAKEISGSFVKDTTAPVITIKGPKSDGYYNAAQNVFVNINELNYKDNKVTIEVTKTVRGKISTVSFPWSNDKAISEHGITLKDTGTYTITVNAADKAGNKAVTKTLSFSVDTVAPAVEISGVKEGGVYSYDASVAPVVTFDDDFLADKNVTITKNGQSWNSNMKMAEGNGSISVSDFDKIKENDGHYTVTALVTDKAGNKTEKTVNFAVNRFGSGFEYDKNLEKINGKHVNNVGADLIIKEYNVTSVSKAVNELKKDGEVVKNPTTETSEKGFVNGQNTYYHSFKESNFDKEGVYELNVISEDNAGNKMESKALNGNVKFTVDKTAPVITASGYEKLNNADSITITIDAVDNLSEPEVNAVVNGETVKLAKTADGSYEFTLSEGRNQQVEIKAVDKAGNEAEFKDSVSVIASGFVYFIYKYKILLAVGGCGIAGVAAYFAFYYRKKKVAVAKPKKGDK